MASDLYFCSTIIFIDFKKMDSSKITPLTVIIFYFIAILLNLSLIESVFPDHLGNSNSTHTQVSKYRIKPSRSI